jgi:hypothetical protein
LKTCGPISMNQLSDTVRVDDLNNSRSKTRGTIFCGRDYVV